MYLDYDEAKLIIYSIYWAYSIYSIYSIYSLLKPVHFGYDVMFILCADDMMITSRRNISRIACNGLGVTLSTGFFKITARIQYT